MELKEKIKYSPMGDSLTKGFGASSIDKTFPSILVNKMYNLQRDNIQLNEGVRDPGKSLKTSAMPFYEKIIKEKPNFITIGYGTNDLNIKRKTEFASPVKFYNMLTKLINELQDNLGDDTFIILITTWNRWDQKHKWIFSFVYDSIIKKVGNKKNIPVADISSVWKNRNDTVSQPRNLDLYGNKGDGFHPNDKGYEEIANIIYKIL